MTAPTVTQGFVIDFSNDVHLEFNQRGSKLRPVCNTKGIIRAETARFYVMENSDVTTKSRNGNIPNQDLGLSFVTCTMEDRYWRKDVDQLDESKITAELRPVLMKDAVGAFGRHADKQIISALDTAGATVIGDYSTGITRNIALQAKRHILNTGMDDDGQICAIITPNIESQLMTIDEYKNADYVGGDLPYKAMGMQVRQWLGVTWLVSTLLTGHKATQTKCYMFHKESLGHAVNAEVQMRFAEKNEGWGWIAKGAMSMGAKAIDPTGMAEIHVNDNAALA